MIKDYAEVTMEVLIDILNRDNEDNAVLAIKIMSDLHKNNLCRPILANFVQPFIDFVIKIYSDYGKLMQKYFKLGSPSQDSNDDVVMSEANESNEEEEESKKSKKRSIPPSTESCKVLIEIPIVLVLLFQTYSDVVKKSIKQIVSKMVESFSISVIPPTPSQPNRQQYLDLISARVKVGVKILAQNALINTMCSIDRFIPNLCSSNYSGCNG